MILYDVRCEREHVFEGWFPSADAFEKQRKGKKISCPLCGSTKVEKAIMAPSVARAAKKGAVEPAAPNDKDKAKAAMKALAKMRTFVQDNCDYVGADFAEEARKIHYKETDPRNIYGEATPEEAKSLREEDIEFAEIPWVRRADG